MNIDDNSNIRQCTSCQMCGAVCPNGAIDIALSKEGFYRPSVHFEKCIDCGLCVKVCYKFDLNIHKSNLSEKTIVAAWSKDREILESSTSGGVADILAKSLVQNGYKCIGVSYDVHHNNAIGTIASNIEEVERLKGSKYIQSLSIDVFKEFVRTNKTQKYAVFGLPCQIYAIDKYLRNSKTRQNHILIDLYCHGCPSLHLWKKYVNEAIKKVNGKGVVSVNFRSKARKWGHFYVVVVVEGVSHPISVISPRTKDKFYDLFFSDLLLNDACQDCQLRSSLEYSDIRLGDFWGKSYIGNEQGVSGVTLCSQIGKETFDIVKEKLNVEEQSFANFIPYQSYGINYNIDNVLRSKLLALLSNENSSLQEIISIYKTSLPLKKRIKYELKGILKLLPNYIGFTENLNNVPIGFNPDGL